MTLNPTITKITENLRMSVYHVEQIQTQISNTNSSPSVSNWSRWMAKLPQCLPLPQAVLASNQEAPYWMKKDITCCLGDHVSVSSDLHKKTGKRQELVISGVNCNTFKACKICRSRTKKRLQWRPKKETDWKFPHANQNIILIKSLFKQKTAWINTETGEPKFTAFGEWN